MSAVTLFAAGAVRALPPSDPVGSYADYSHMEDCAVFQGKIDPAGQKIIDARSCDLSRADLSAFKSSDTDRLEFDSKTIWPVRDKMPAGFSPAGVLRAGMTPGLNIKKLHDEGIDGSGVTVAIIDQPLSYHREYGSNILLYKDFFQSDFPSQGSMHGAAVASIAVGKTLGAAPGAGLVYIASNYDYRAGKTEPFNASWIAYSLNYLAYINNILPDNEKISVVSISRGFSAGDDGYAAFEAAEKKVEAENIAVFTTNDIFTVSRYGYEADPEKSSSYKLPAEWLGDKDYESAYSRNVPMVPTSYRITASPTGHDDYVAYSEGGLSWGVPYLSGIYAMAKQVYPGLDKKVFLEYAKKTAYKNSFVKNGRSYTVNYFVNPEKLIKTLREKHRAEGKEAGK